MRILVLSNLFPNPVRPRHGIFIEERIRHLRHAHPEIEVLVVAPVPWFPFQHGPFGDYTSLARVPSMDERNGVRILHPRYPVIPKVGMSVAPLLMAAALMPVLRRIKQHKFNFDLIDAHFLYPDGVVAVHAGRCLGVPTVVTARGSDLSLYRQWRIPRTYLRWCLRNASAVAGVCRALVEEAEALAGPLEHTYVFRNGVDLGVFNPDHRASTRIRLGLGGFTLISVGHLLEHKGHHLVIEALTRVADATLLIAGEGAMRKTLEALAIHLGVSERVRFLGEVPHRDLPAYYAAADALVLASSREGLANVLLEAMACGTPVVATAVGGTPEVVRGPAAGVLVTERTPQEIALGIHTLRQSGPNRAATRAYAEQYSWEATSNAQWRLFQLLVARPDDTTGAVVTAPERP